MEILCFSTFLHTLRPCLEGPISNTNLTIKLLQPIIDCENLVSKTGEPLIIDTDITSKWMTRKRDIYNPIKSALNKRRNKNFKIVEIKGLNHLFQESETGLPAEYAIIEQTISPKALKVMLDWIKKR